MSPQDLLTTREVAAYLRRSVLTLQKWRTRGVGPRYIATPGMCLYRRVDVEAWLSEHPLGPASRDIQDDLN